MKVLRRGIKLALVVEPIAGNLPLAKEIPAPIKWSGNTALVDPRPEAVLYIANTWPGIEGIDKYLKKIKTPTLTESTIPWKLKITPFEHQKSAFVASWAKRAFALFMQMGTGKTYVILLNAAWLAHKGQLNGLLIIAPQGIHRKWINQEMPKFWPDCVPHKKAFWRATPRVAEKEQLQQTLDFDGMSILAMNVEALSTSQTARSTALGFLKSRVAMCVVDESTDIKTPGAKRSKAVCRIGKWARYRRILTGSPGLPSEVYGQFNFLGKGLLGYETFEAFKNDFAVMVNVMGRNGQPLMHKNKEILTIAKDATGKPQFRNVDRLRELMATYSYRVTKDECFDLPPKTMLSVPVEMTAEQWKHYKEIAKKCYTEFYGKNIETPLVIQKLVRHRQIVSGWLPISEEEVRPIGKVNVKIERIKRLLDETQGPVVLWGNFTHECIALADAIQEGFSESEIIRYWGTIDADEREKGIDTFQAGNARFFVGNPQCGGRGIDLFAAATMIFMSNSFSWEKREQAEDRIHRSGQMAPMITYVDVYAENTIDQYIISMLQAKKDVCDELTGDQLLEVLVKDLW